ncbi:MAG: MBL fold metallo-hydrolase [Patescibacteria group bacterium]|nr:MBL fold metallo-hydrolase [Patescibacteria group bacterium]MDD5715571.1 MBL fold metallo-hydrolase [Patescibacteria group bacterium]
MKLTILGSGTLVPSAKRSASAYLLEAGDKAFLLDSGEGTKRRMAEAGRDPLTLDYLMYTHTHVDHVAELPALLWYLHWGENKRTRELQVVGPKGFKKFFKKMLQAYWPQFYEKAGYPVAMTEMKNSHIEIGNVMVKTRALEEQTSTLVKNSIGYRVEYEGLSFVYTGDVGFSEAVVKLAKKADLLLIDSAAAQPMPGHCTPSQAGELASKARVKKLALTHFYPAVERIDILGEARKTFQGEIIIAQDLMEITI